MSESENASEQMDLGSGTASSNEVNDSNVSMNTATSDVPTSTATTIGEQVEQPTATAASPATTPTLKLTVKTPKDKKDISIDPSANVKQVKIFFDQ